MYLHLFIGSDSTKDNLSEALCWKHTEAHPSNNSVFLDETKRFVFPVHPVVVVTVVVKLYNFLLVTNIDKFLLPPSKKEVMFLVRSVCLFVCLSVGLLANL